MMMIGRSDREQPCYGIHLDQPVTSLEEVEDEVLLWSLVQLSVVEKVAGLQTGFLVDLQIEQTLMFPSSWPDQRLGSLKIH